MAGYPSIDPAGARRPQARDESDRRGVVTEDDHDRSLIVERLAWTPEQRLEANAAFLRFYRDVRPDGPLVHDG
jgi:hypothetical protein